MAKPAPSLADTIGAALPPRPRCLPWWLRLDDATRAELETVRERWRAGGYDTSKRTLARTVSAHLKASGIATVGEQGVTIWLNAK
jgi:hypothetical protein